ncbi:hypothetical protein [Erythrobacter colymbi]|uniref:hypothetical protein n=1 Tax=Erythrobacter colymbi TaxID=1161202 RepID=UPI000A360061|nr:hypothetical protein [Erythrobacter colymbi]
MNALLSLRFQKTAHAAGEGIVPLPVSSKERTSAANAARPPLRGIAADLCYFVLRLSGWLSLTLLATLGLYTVFFMALGAFSAEGFFAHLANLSVRFGDADTARQGLFVRQLAVVTLILFLIVSAARYRSLAAVFSAEPAPRKD